MESGDFGRAFEAVRGLTRRLRHVVQGAAGQRHGITNSQPRGALSRRLNASNACRIASTFSCDIAYSARPTALRASA
jgi:hypothetical protein